MKNIKNISMLIIAIIVLQFVAIGIIVGTSKVQDVTLATDNVVECNDGWEITTVDGTTTKILSMPYYGKSNADEIVVAKRVVSANMCGETLCFLSADKRLQIFVGDELIYSFGVDDKRVIGSTPGSVMVFADIPEDSEGKMIKIKMQSPLVMNCSPVRNGATHMSFMQKSVAARKNMDEYKNIVFSSIDA